MTSTILSHRPTLLKTMAPLDAGGYAEGLRLTCLLTHVGPGSIELDRAELRAVLRELPTALLLEVLGERGLTKDLAYTQAGPVVDTGVCIRVCLNDAHGTYLKLTPAEFAVGKARAQEEQDSEAEGVEDVQLLACTSINPLNAPLTEAEAAELQAAVAPAWPRSARQPISHVGRPGAL